MEKKRKKNREVVGVLTQLPITTVRWARYRIPRVLLRLLLFLSEYYIIWIWISWYFFSVEVLSFLIVLLFFSLSLSSLCIYFFLLQGGGQLRSTLKELWFLDRHKSCPNRADFFKGKGKKEEIIKTPRHCLGLMMVQEVDESCRGYTIYLCFVFVFKKKRKEK